MNNSTRNLKMKKLLIATTALVATAGMASADITISGHAAAGIYSGLSNKDCKAAAVAATAINMTIKQTAYYSLANALLLQQQQRIVDTNTADVRLHAS